MWDVDLEKRTTNTLDEPRFTKTRPDTIKQKSILVHILKGEKYSLLKLILTRKIDGKREQGRKQHSWLLNNRNWCGIRRVQIILRKAEEKRSQWSTKESRWTYTRCKAFGTRRRRRSCCLSLLYWYHLKSFIDRFSHHLLRNILLWWPIFYLKCRIRWQLFSNWAKR